MTFKSLAGRHRPCVDMRKEGMALCFQDRAGDGVGAVALDQCVGHLYFGFGSRGWNPFTHAVKTYLEQGHWHPLEEYYQAFQPRSLAEAYFQRNHPRWGVLNDRSPFLRLKPWRDSEIPMSGHEGGGNQNFGPITPAKLAQEIRKYESIIKSIRKRGYQPERYGTIRGYFLLDHGGDHVFRITQGMHRAPVLDAMGWKTLPVSFDPVMPRYISLDSMRYWPRLTDGTFTPGLASYMFKRHFWDRGDAKQAVLGGRR